MSGLGHGLPRVLGDSKMSPRDACDEMNDGFSLFSHMAHRLRPGYQRSLRLAPLPCCGVNRWTAVGVVRTCPASHLEQVYSVVSDHLSQPNVPRGTLPNVSAGGCSTKVQTNSINELERALTEAFKTWSVCRCVASDRYQTKGNEGAPHISMSQCAEGAADLSPIDLPSAD